MNSTVFHFLGLISKYQTAIELIPSFDLPARSSCQLLNRNGLSHIVSLPQLPLEAHILDQLPH